MKTLHRKRILLSLLLLFLTATSHKPKETFKDIVFYVTDPNGIFLFPDPRDVRNRIAVPYKTGLVSLGSEKFSIPSKNNEEEEKCFEKLLYKQKVYYAEESNADKFIKLEPPDSNLYTYTQVPNAIIYSLPFKDSKVIKKISEFSMLQVIGKSQGANVMIDYPFYDSIWLEVAIDESVPSIKGFVLYYEVLEIDSLDIIKQSLENKIRDRTGVFQVTVENSLLYENLENLAQAKYIDSKYKHYLPKKGEYTRVIRSLEKKGIRYYLILNLKLREEMNRKVFFSTDWKDSEKYFWISGEYGKFLSEMEFAKYSFQNSKYKEDLNLFKIFEWKQGGMVNYDTLQASKYFSNKYNTEFYLIKFQYGTDGNFYYFIVERKGNQFKEIVLAVDVMYAEGVKIFTKIIGDMDGDGYPEFIGRYQSSRTGIGGEELYSFQNGKLKHIISFPDKCIPDFNREFITCFEEKYIKGADEKHKPERQFMIRYKFVKGKLYQEAAKDKWEEVKPDREE